MLFATVKPRLTSSVFGYFQVIIILKQSDYHLLRLIRRHFFYNILYINEHVFVQLMNEIIVAGW